MIIELKPEHQEILEKATRSGKTQQEVLDHAFEIIREEQEMDGWLLENRDEIAAQIEEGVAQAERGELIDPEEVMRILAEDRERWRRA